MISRVDHLRIRLLVPEVARAQTDELRRVVERELVVRVLESIEQEVHARFGARAIVRIRHLPARWRIEASALALADTAARLGRDTAALVLERIESTPRPDRLRPRGDAELVCFEDAAHASAAYLADRAEGREAWFHPPAGPVDAAWRGVVAEGAPAVRGTLGWLERMDAVAAVLAATDEAVIDELVAALPLPSWPAAARSALERRPSVPAAAQPGTAGETREPIARSSIAPSGASSIEAPPPSPAPAAERAAAAPRAAPAAANRSIDPDAAARDTAVDAPRDASPGVTIGAAEADLDADRATAHAGLFYLVGRVLELDLAEHLWCAGLPEGDVLCQVAAALVGAGPDPAWRYFGGAFDRELAAITAPAWALGEATERIQHALGVRLVRFGVATTPDVLHGDLARIAATIAPDPGLAPEVAALVAHCAAALAILTGARLGEPASAARLRALVSRPGGLRVTPDTLWVAVAGEVDVDVRRAGLDQDPGHAPWLGRRVRFAFADTVVL